MQGLRREEVALLAGISVEYYTRLERGNAAACPRTCSTASPGRCSSTRPSGPTSSTSSAPRRPDPPPPGAGRAQERVRPVVQRILDSMADVARLRAQRPPRRPRRQPARGGAFYSPQFDDPIQPPNSARFVFLEPAGRPSSSSTGTRIANDTVAILRAEAGRDPYDKRLSDLIGELSTRSEEFRVRWAAHDVKLHRTGVKRFHHPVVGDLTLDFEALELPGDPGQQHPRLHRRTRLASAGGARPARQLGRDTETARSPATCRARTIRRRTMDFNPRAHREGP